MEIDKEPNQDSHSHGKETPPGQERTAPPGKPPGRSILPRDNMDHFPNQRHDGRTRTPAERKHFNHLAGTESGWDATQCQDSSGHRRSSKRSRRDDSTKRSRDKKRRDKHDREPGGSKRRDRRSSRSPHQRFDGRFVSGNPSRDVVATQPVLQCLEQPTSRGNLGSSRSDGHRGVAATAAPPLDTCRPGEQKTQELPRQERKSPGPHLASAIDGQQQHREGPIPSQLGVVPPPSSPAPLSHGQVRILERPKVDVHVTGREDSSGNLTPTTSHHHREASHVGGEPTPPQQDTMDNRASKGSTPVRSINTLPSGALPAAVATIPKIVDGQYGPPPLRSRHRAGSASPSRRGARPAPDQGRQRRVSPRSLEQLSWKYMTSLPASDTDLIRSEFLRYVENNLQPHGQLFGLNAVNLEARRRNAQTKHLPPDERRRQRASALHFDPRLLFDLPPRGQAAFPEPIAWVPVSAHDYREVSTLARDLLNSRHQGSRATILQELFRLSMLFNGEQSLAAKTAVAGCYAKCSLEDAMMAILMVKEGAIAHEAAWAPIRRTEVAGGTWHPNPAGEDISSQGTKRGSGSGQIPSETAPPQALPRRPDNLPQGPPVTNEEGIDRRKRQLRAPSSVEQGSDSHQMGQDHIGRVQASHPGDKDSGADQSQPAAPSASMALSSPKTYTTRDPRKLAPVPAVPVDSTSSEASRRHLGRQTSNTLESQPTAPLASAALQEESKEEQRSSQGKLGTSSQRTHPVGKTENKPQGGPRFVVHGLGNQEVTFSSPDGVMMALDKVRRPSGSAPSDKTSAAKSRESSKRHRNPVSPSTSPSEAPSMPGERRERDVPEPKYGLAKRLDQKGHPSNSPTPSAHSTRNSSQSGSSRSSSGSDAERKASHTGNSRKKTRQDEQAASSSKTGKHAQGKTMGYCEGSNQRSVGIEPTVARILVAEGQLSDGQITLHSAVNPLHPDLFENDAAQQGVSQLIELPHFTFENEAPEFAGCTTTLSLAPSPQQQQSGLALGVVNSILPADIFNQDEDELVLTANDEYNLDEAGHV